MKVAVLGGGMGGVTAAWHLAHAGHDVTVYQRGWRLGGKGASGRNAGEHNRIEEHGLHLLMGFYGTAFRLLKDVYDEALKAPGNGKLLPFGQAFQGWDTCVFSRERQNGTWSFLPVNFLPKPGAPWDPAPPPDFSTLFRDGVGVLAQIHAELRRDIPDPTSDAVVDAAIQTLLKIPFLTPDASRAIFEGLVMALKPVITATAQLVKSEREEWLFIAFCFVLGNALAMVRDGLIQPKPDFDRVNGVDYREWIGSALDKVGAPDWASRTSAFVTALYDLAFSRDRDYSLAAGVTVKTVLLLGLGYRGHVAFKMNAGMGDVVFAPFDIALRRLPKVKFEYFHRVTALRLDANKTHIETIEVERQVATPGGYEPLVEVDGLACWPHEPKTALLDVKYQSDYQAGKRYDFERDPLPSPYRRDTNPHLLKRGADFDVVVLAIPVGALSGIAGDLMKQHAAFADMVNGIRTVRTMALQVWLHSAFKQLKSPAPEGMVISYKQPFNSWADMSQVLAHEQWPVAKDVKNVAYFCDAAPKEITDLAGVIQAGTDWLQKDVKHLWPGFAFPDHLVAVYPRGNFTPTEGYVLTEAGATAKRLDAGTSGFVNLALAGDWVKTELNSGCLEAATMGGLAAAQAILTNKVKP